MLFWDNLRRRHPIGDEELNAYIDGELDAAASSRVEAHMESCAACRETVGELRTVSQALQSLPRVQAPRSFALREVDVEPAPARTAGWLAGATPLLGGVAAVAFLAFFVLVGVDVTDRSEDSDAMSAGASLSSEMTERNTALDAEMPEGLPEADEATRDAENALPSAGDGAAPPEEAPLAAAGDDIPNDDLSNNGDVISDEGGPDDTSGGFQVLEPGDDDSSRLRIAEAATAAVAIAAGGLLALVWWRRRA